MYNELPLITTRYEHVNNFINTIAPIVCNEWLRRKHNGEKTISPAVVIAQACIESGYNLEASTLFGIKGEGVIANTQEYINGAYIDIVDSFQKYNSTGEAVVGYYDLMQRENYDDATSQDTVEGELNGLTNEIGYPYATSPTYYDNCLSIINDYGLRVYNEYVRSIINTEETVETVEEITTVNEEAIKVGDKVRVLLNVNYDNNEPFDLYYDEYDVIEVNGDRVVIGVDDRITSAISINNIEKIVENKDIKVGDKVRVLLNVNYENNEPFILYYDEYDVIEVNGDRVVIGVDDRITSAISINNIEKV